MRSILQISQRFVIDQDELLGKGSTGNVYLGFQASNYNKKYAVKAIDLSKITNPVTQYLLSCQIQALTDLTKQNSQHIVKLQSQPIFHEQFIYLVMELLQGGSLADLIQQNRKGIQQIQALKLFTQILKGYRVIQQQEIVHRDIKPDNLIFRKIYPNDQQIILPNELCFIDFGYCLKQSVPNKPQGYYNVGSPKYMSPQAFKGSKYSQKSDIWAMGVILYEMLHGTTIDAGMNMEQYFDKMEHEGLVNRKGINQQIWQLLVGMLEYRADKRWNLSVIQEKVNFILKRGNINTFKRPDSRFQIQNKQINQFPVYFSNAQPSQNQQYASSVLNKIIVNQNQKRIVMVQNHSIQNQLPFQKQALPYMQINQSRPVNSNIIQQQQTIIYETKISPTNISKFQQVKIKSPLNISDRFIIDEDQLLGKGSTGNVYLGFQSNNTSKKYAVKAIDLSQVTNPVTQYLLSCEIVALTDLAKKNCKYIVKLLDIIFHDKYCYLVMQLLQGGSLADYIRDNSKGIDEKKVINLFRQILQAYGVIRDLQIIHRDIKPDNLIFRKEIQQNNQLQSENQLCFIDFGYCLKQSVPNKPQGYYNVGSPKYMSPQAFKGSKYSQKSDIWAMGVILYEMLHGTTIDAGMNMEQYFDKMEHEGLVNRKGINQQIWQLLVGMLSYRVQKRLQYSEIRIRLQRMVAASSVYRGESEQNKQILFTHQKQPITITQNQQLQNNQSQRYNEVIPQLQFHNVQQNNQMKLFQNSNLNSRRSQRSSTQQPAFFHQQNQPKYFAKSHIFPEQYNSQVMKRYPSFQNMIQPQNISHTPIKINSSPKILQMNPPNFVSNCSPLQKIEQERHPQNNMKRSLIIRQDSNEKIRKMNLNKTYFENDNNKYETVILNKGVNHSINVSQIRPGQQMIRNPQIFQLGPNESSLKNEKFRQSIGVMQSMNFYPIDMKNISPQRLMGNFSQEKHLIIKQNIDVSKNQRIPVNEVRSQNVIRQQIIKGENNKPVNMEMRRQMSLKKLNQSPYRNGNINQVPFLQRELISNQSNLRETLNKNENLRWSMLPIIAQNNIPLVHINSSITTNQINNKNIQRAPSKIMGNENEDIFESSFQISNKKSVQTYFMNPSTMGTKNNNFSNLNNTQQALNNNEPRSLENNMGSLTLDSFNKNNIQIIDRKNLNNGQQKMRVFHGPSNQVIFISEKRKSGVNQLFSQQHSVIQSRFVDSNNKNKDLERKFEINSVQNSGQKLTHEKYFQMNDMGGENNQIQISRQIHNGYPHSPLRNNLLTNQNVYINNINNQQQNITHLNRSMNLPHHQIQHNSQNPHFQSQVQNSHYQSQVQPHRNPQFIGHLQQSHIQTNKNQNQNVHPFIHKNLQPNQTNYQNSNNNLQYQKILPKSETNFYQSKININGGIRQQMNKDQNKYIHVQHRNEYKFLNNNQPIQNQERRVIYTDPNIIRQNNQNNKSTLIPVQQISVPTSTTKIFTHPIPQLIHQQTRIIGPHSNNNSVQIDRNPQVTLKKQVYYQGLNHSKMFPVQIPTRDNNVQTITNQNNSNIRYY